MVKKGRHKRTKAERERQYREKGIKAVGRTKDERNMAYRYIHEEDAMKKIQQPPQEGPKPFQQRLEPAPPSWGRSDDQGLIDDDGDELEETRDELFEEPRMPISKPPVLPPPVPQMPKEEFTRGPFHEAPKPPVEKEPAPIFEMPKPAPQPPVMPEKEPAPQPEILHHSTLEQQKQDIQRLMDEDIPKLEDEVATAEIERQIKESFAASDNWWEKWNQEMDELLKF